MPSLKLPIVGSPGEQPAPARTQWRSLEERERGLETTGEFPPGASEIGGTSRREFVQLLGASMAFAGAAGCFKQPPEQILPYTRPPEEIVPGRPLHYATASTLGGRATGLLITAFEGRATKVEGNPEHPSSLGATGLFEQASILQLYDPNRGSVLQEKNRPRSWREFLAAQNDRANALRAKDGGAGSASCSSPGPRRSSASCASGSRSCSQRAIPQLLGGLRGRRPAGRATRVRLRPGDALRSFQGARDRLPGSRPSLPVARLDPGHARLGGQARARTWDEPPVRRRVRAQRDGHERRPPATHPSLSAGPGRPGAGREARSGGRRARTLAALGARSRLDPRQQRFVDALARDLSRAGRQGVVMAGPRSPALVHALVHAINSSLSSEAVRHQKPLLHDAETGAEGLRELAAEIRAGAVDTLVVTAANPVHTAPYELNLAKALDSVPNSIYRGLYQDETSQRCGWFVPATHPLEDWGDARAHDGTVTFLQPLVQPLFNGIAEAQVLAAFPRPGRQVALRPAARALAVGARGRGGRLGEVDLRRIHPGSASAAESPQLRVDAVAAAALAARFDAAGPALELNVVPDYRLYDGRFANNVWLQETPDPSPS